MAGRKTIIGSTRSIRELDIWCRLNDYHIVVGRGFIDNKPIVTLKGLISGR